MVAPLLLAAALAVQPGPIRMLFIGNSLTYTNDLPALVCAMAAAAGRKAVCESVAKPDYGLEEHWNGAAWATDPGLALYGPDGFHPSPMGTYLAALVIYEQIFASAPPPAGAPAAAPQVLDLLKRAARDTVTAQTKP